MNNIHAAIEIGTSRTVLAIGESENGGRVRITCHAEIPSAGVRKSQIYNLDDASRSIRSVLQRIVNLQTEYGNSLTIGNAFLTVSGPHVKVDPYNASIQIARSQVGTGDIADVEDAVRHMPLPSDRELLDILEQDFTLDSTSGISSPKGMTGRILRLNTLQIHAGRNHIDDARNAAEGAHLEIREPVFAATCAAEAVLEEHEKKNGVLVLDIGGGSTGYAAYSDGYLVAAGVIGVGGEHITNDIIHAFQTTHGQAELIKKTEASAVIGRITEDNARVKIPGSTPLMETRTLSRRALDTVVNARVRELFSILREELSKTDLLQRLHSGTVITGGGAALRGIDAVIQRELGTPVRLGRPIHVDGLDEAEFPPAFAAIAGTLLYAHRNYEDKPFLKTLFGGLFK